MADTIPEASNLLLVSRTRSFTAIAADLSALFLGGLDVQFIEVGSSRALLRKHIVRALQAQHSEREPTEILRSLGAGNIGWGDAAAIWNSMHGSIKAHGACSHRNRRYRPLRPAGRCAAKGLNIRGGAARP